MAGCTAGPHISRSQLILTVIGFVGFTFLALGAVSDYWVTYGINAGTPPPSGNGTFTSTAAVLTREGLWRVCLQSAARNSTTITGHVCFFGMSAPETVLNGASSRYQVGYLIGTWVLIAIGVVMTLVAEVMAMAALRQRKNRRLIRSVGATFIFGALIAILGLIIYAVRTSSFLGQWTQETSPYTSATLAWSYAISWVGDMLCLLAGTGHLWILRGFEDNML